MNVFGKWFYNWFFGWLLTFVLLVGQTVKKVENGSFSLVFGFLTLIKTQCPTTNFYQISPLYMKHMA